VPETWGIKNRPLLGAVNILFLSVKHWLSLIGESVGYAYLSDLSGWFPRKRGWIHPEARWVFSYSK